MYSLKILLYHTIYTLSITFDAAKNRYREAFLIRIITATSWAKKISGRLLKKKKEFVLFRSLFPSSRSIPFIFSLDSFSQSWTDCLKAFRKLFYERIFVRSRRFPVETKIPISFHLSLSPNYRVNFAEWNASLVKKKKKKKKQEKNFTDIWSLLINTYLSNNWRRNTIK